MWLADCLPVFLPVCLYVSPSVYFCGWLAGCLSSFRSACMSARLFTSVASWLAGCLPACLPSGLLVCQPVCLLPWLPAGLPAYLSVMSACMSACLSVCLSACHLIACLRVFTPGGCLGERKIGLKLLSPLLYKHGLRSKNMQRRELPPSQRRCLAQVQGTQWLQ